MTGTIEENASTILAFLASLARADGGASFSTGRELREATGLSPNEINDAVTVLEESGLVNWIRTLGTAPFAFSDVEITPRGRYELERIRREAHTAEAPIATISRPPSPVGSPFGFTDLDWESVSERKSRGDVLLVVMGYQFESEYYDSKQLLANVRDMTREAVRGYNTIPGAIQVDMEFQALAAGYGEHLFNEIARDIISADIAVFDTSDLNPNVMLEMGVALTWGVRVLPIKEERRPKPPSDISGQTWADYRDSGSEFTDPNHMRKLVRMIERAARKRRPA